KVEILSKVSSRPTCTTPPTSFSPPVPGPHPCRMGPAFSACGERSRGCFWIEQKNCHFGSSQRCAFVFAAPRTFVIRVKKVKSGTGEGVDNEIPVSREARDIHFEAAGEGTCHRPAEPDLQECGSAVKKRPGKDAGASPGEWGIGETPC